MDNIDLQNIRTICEFWANREGVKLCDKLDELLLNLVEQHNQTFFIHTEINGLIKQTLLLRNRIGDIDNTSLSSTCKYLITGIVKSKYFDGTNEAQDATVGIKSKALLDIVGVSLDTLYVIGEHEYCYGFIDRLISDLSSIQLCENKPVKVKALLLLVECFFNSIISVKLKIDHTMFIDKVFCQNDRFYNLLSYSLFQAEDKVLSSLVLFAVIPKFLELSKKTNTVKVFWSAINSCADTGSLQITLSDKLYVLCGLSNYFIPDEGSDFFILKSNEFWELVQQGLLSSNALSRKRGLYLLKRSVDVVSKFNIQIDQELFDWNYLMAEELHELWDKMFILLEVLEEKQSHLVIPVLRNLLKQIVDSTQIHPNWILVLYLRLLSHESLQVLRFGIIFFLNINVNVYLISPLKSNVIDLLFLKMNNMFLFSFQSSETENSLVDIDLKSWFTNILLDVKHYSEFYNIIVNAIVKIRWCIGPLFHVIYNMSLIPIAEIFESSSLIMFSEFLKEVIQTQNVYIRGAVQCALLNLLSKHTKENIDLLTIVNTLTVFRQNECLQRGLVTWDTSKDWISSYSYLEANESLISKLMYKENSLSSESKARILVLLIDSGIIKLDSTFDMTMKSYFSILVGTRFRSSSEEESDKCIHMLLYIVMESRMFPFEMNLNNDPLVKSLLPYINETIPYIWKRFYDLDKLEHMSSIDLYMMALHRLSDNGLVGDLNEDDLDMYYAVEKLSTSNKSSSVQRFFALKVFHWFIHYLGKNLPSYCLENSVKSYCLAIISKGHLLEILPKDSIDESATRNHKTLWGKLTSGYICTMWLILQKSIDNGYISLQDISSVTSADDIIEVAMTSIETGGKDALIPILSVIKHIQSSPVKSLELCKRFIELSWKSCYELRKDASFWPAFSSWVEMSFNNHTINGKITLPILIEFSEEIIRQGEVVSGLANVLLTHLRHELKRPELVLPLLRPLTSALLFGPVLRKDQRVENETSDKIRSLGSDYAVNSLIPEDRTRSNSDVRMSALSIVLGVASHEGGEAVVLGVVQELLAVEAKLTARRQRYHGDSSHHRIKNRIVQALLVLEAILAQSTSVKAQACVAELIKWSSRSLQVDSQQPSIRYQLEWLLVRSLLHSPQLLHSFWTIYSQASEERTGSVCSFISVAYHLAAILKDKEFIDRCVTEILPWCMAQHFNLRLYAQVVLQKLCPLDYQVKSKYEAVFNSLTKSLNQGNAVRNADKLKNDFYFTDFHPLNHFSLETIFWELPRLSNISKDEWVPLSTLQHYTEGLDSVVPLANPDDKLKVFAAATWVVKATAEPEVDVGVEASGMQKKFVPWKSMFPELETAKSGSRTELIVVASLIDKLPNLGGLARSCEVFTAECLVVPSLEYTQDKTFATLSMSAEKHISIVEVKPHNLPHYLREKKACGYTLVGAEQTAASESLETYKFPKKCLLLLGNEKEGIPVSLLPLLDVCVEVRQLGVVRSLNVHVTGALFLWEYTRQYLDYADGIGSNVTSDVIPSTSLLN